jgi:hypothetical protein
MWQQMTSILRKEVPDVISKFSFIAVMDENGKKGFIIQLNPDTKLDSSNIHVVNYGGQIFYFTFFVDDEYVKDKKLPKEILDIMHSIPYAIPNLDTPPFYSIKAPKGKITVSKCLDCPFMALEAAPDHYMCQHPEAPSADILYVDAKIRKIPKLCPLIRGEVTIALSMDAKVKK